MHLQGDDAFAAGQLGVAVVDFAHQPAVDPLHLDLLEDQKLVIEEMSKQFDIQDFDLKDVLFSRTEKDRHAFTSFDRDLHVKEIIKLANAFKGMTSSK